MMPHLLMSYYCSSNELRKVILKPADHDVDFRSSCYCHKTVIDIGYVCSVCLTVFCKFHPVCLCCHSKFEFPSKRK